MNDVWYDPAPEPKDPCNRQCGVSSATGLCSGCFRTLNEIAEWDQMTMDDQRVVLERVAARAKSGQRERNWDLLNRDQKPEKHSDET